MNLRSLAGVVLASLILALVCTAAPLFVYATTLSAFGLAHVATELRYVDQRFSARLGGATLRAVVGLLLLVVLLRVAAFVPQSSALPLREMELGTVAALAAVAVVVGWRRGDVGTGVVAAAVMGAIGWGIARAPSSTLVVLAFLHNLTPVGFLAERLRGAERRHAMVLCALVFVVVPAVIGAGLVTASLQRLDWWRPDLAPFAVGAIELHLGAFVPGPWIDGAFAIDLFAAAVYLQCVHYAVVIGVLPRLGAADAASGSFTLVRWPQGRRWAGIVAVASVIACLGFVPAFADARRLYGVASAVHAWSEIPVLLLSIGVGTSLGRGAPHASVAPA